MDSIKTYCISRSCDKDRRMEMVRQFSKQDWPVIFYNAICPKDINGWSLKIDHDAFNNSFNRNIRPGEIGIWESNYDILLNFINDDEYEYICVFEDDTMILQKYKYIMHLINNNKHIDCLMHDFRFGNFIELETNNNLLSKLEPSWVCSNAYIINKKLAKYIVDKYKNNAICEPWDHIFPKLSMDFGFYSLKRGNEWATINFHKNFQSNIS